MQKGDRGIRTFKKQTCDKQYTSTIRDYPLMFLKEAALKNLITFNDAGDMYLYESADDFVDVYPFIPYQFKLLW